MHFILTFENGTEWKSPNLFEDDPGWASEENGRLGGIRKMEIPVTKDRSIIFTGFEKYNFFVEALQNLNGGGKTQIESFNFCGAIKGRVLSYKLIPKTRQIIKSAALEGKEYQGTATRGWRAGIFGAKPQEGICSR